MGQFLHHFNDFINISISILNTQCLYVLFIFLTTLDTTSRDSKFMYFPAGMHRSLQNLHISRKVHMCI